MSIETDARQTAEEYTRRHIGGMQPVETVGDKVRAAFEAGAVWAREQGTRGPSAAEAEAVARAFCREWPLIPMGDATEVAVDALLAAQQVRRG